MKLRKFLSMVTIIAMLFTLCCGAMAEEPYRVALVIGVGGLGDGSFNDSLKAGCDQAVASLGIVYDIIEPVEVSEFEGDFTMLCEDGSYDLIVCGGFDATEACAAVAANYPDQQFLFVDGAVDNDTNVTSVTFRDNEKTYMLGMVAAQMTEADSLGLVVALDIPTLNLFAAGFIAGAQSVNPDIVCNITYVGGFADTTTAKEQAISLHDNGADIVYAAAGGSGLGVFTAAAEEGFLAIGTDTNQCLINPDVIFLSGIRLINNAIENGIAAAIEGTLVPGATSMGLAENALTITNEGSNIEMDPAYLESAFAAAEEIINGTIVVPTTLEEINFR